MIKFPKNKRVLLSTVAVASLAVPVLATQNMTALRGAFPANHMAQHTYAANAYVCAECAPNWGQNGQAHYNLRPAPQVYGQSNMYAEQPAYAGQHMLAGQAQMHQPNSYTAPQTVQYGTPPQAVYGTAQPTMVYGATTQNGMRGLANPFGPGHGYKMAEYTQAQPLSRDYNIGGITVRTNAAHTDRMLDWQENQTGKTVTLLANRASGVLQPNSLYIGGGVKGGFMWQKTSDAGNFPILSRFPFFSASTDKEAGVFAINNAAFAFTSTFGDWTTVYMQPEYSETEYGSNQDEFQLRKAYVVFGNLKKSPLYAAFGRKDIDFGNFDSYNAFTHNEAAHYFLAHSDQPVLELGYYNNGLKISGSAFSGGRQLRVAYAEEENNIANYAFNAEKEFVFGRGNSFTVGGGYLHDTIYRNNWTAHTFNEINTGTPPTNFISYRNSAVSAFAEYNSPFFDAMVEYTSTLEPWAAAIPQDADGFVDPAYLIDPAGSPNDINNINFDQNLDVLVAQLRVKPIVNGRQMHIAAVGSWGNIGDDFTGVGIGGRATTWEKNQQHAVSLEYPVSPYLDIGAEYVYNKGFIPFVAPQLVSNDETTAHAINVGFKARF